MRRIPYSWFATASAIIAIAALVSPEVLGERMAVRTALPLFLIWTVTVSVALWIYKARSLWLLLGLPGVLLWPGKLGMMAWACAHSNVCP
jgi:hypothetical protein